MIHKKSRRKQPQVAVMPLVAGAFYPSSYPQSRFPGGTKELLGEYFSFLAKTDDERDKWHPHSSALRARMLKSATGSKRFQQRKIEVLSEVHRRLQAIAAGEPAEKMFPPRPKQKTGKWVHPVRDESIAFEVLRLMYVEHVKEAEAKRLVQDEFEAVLDEDIGMDAVPKAVTKWRRSPWFSKERVKLYSDVLRAHGIITG